VTIVLTFFLYFSYVYLFLYAIQNLPSSLLTLNLTPFNTMAQEYMIAFFSTFMILRFISIIMFYISCIIYSALCYIFWKEYNHVSNQLETMISKNEENEIKINFEHYRQQHQAVTRILNIGNNIIQQFAFVMYCFGIPTVCFTMYGIIKGTLESADLTTLLNFLLFVIFGIIFVTVMGSKVNSAVCISSGILQYKNN